jgi:hypothetical protein
MAQKGYLYQGRMPGSDRAPDAEGDASAASLQCVRRRRQPVVDLLEVRRDDSRKFHRKRTPKWSRSMQQGIEWRDYPEMTTFVGQIGVPGLSKLNGLSPDENRELFACRDLPRLVELVLIGLGNALKDSPAL